jgi:uroporphyrinogen-III decarboxylase
LRREGRAVAESFIRAVEKYEYDGIVVDISTTTLAGALGVPVDLPEDLPARTKGSLLASLEAVAELPEPDISGYFEVRTLLEAVSLIKAHFKDDVAVRGNCDQCPFSLAASVRGMENWMLDLALGTPALVEQKTRELLEIFAGEPRFILNAGCAIPAETPPQNLRAMIRTARMFTL